MKYRSLAAAASIGFGLLMPPAHAFRVSPMVEQFDPSGNGSTKNFLIENNGKEKVALEVQMLKRSAEPDGREIREETRDFTVFPEQVVLEPGERRNVRVTWTGAQNLAAELPYRLSFEQLPVDLKQDSTTGTSANVKFVLQYVASVYVTPHGAKPKVEIQSVKRADKKNIELVLKNSGTAHQVTSGAKLRFYRRTADGKKADQYWSATPEALKYFDSDNLLPGLSRKFVLPASADIPEGEIQADIEFPRNGN